MTDPLARLRLQGMDIGVCVTANAGSTDPKDYWRVDAVTEDEVRLSNWSDAASARDSASARDVVSAPTSVALAEFLRTWGPGSAKEVNEKHPGWPQCRPLLTEAGVVLFSKARALAALGFVTQMVDDTLDPVSKVTVYHRPCKKVLASALLPTGGLVLVPESTTVKAAPRPAPLTDSAAVEVSFVPADPRRQFLLQPCTQQDSVAALWCVQGTENANEANMVWAKYSVLGVFGVDFHGRPRPTRAILQGADQVAASSSSAQFGSAATAARTRIRQKQPETAEASSSVSDAAGEEDGGEEVVTYGVEIPVLINSQPIPAGGELLVFRPRAPKREREVAAITVTRLTKAQRRT